MPVTEKIKRGHRRRFRWSRFFVAAWCIGCSFTSADAQSWAGSSASVETLKIVEMPTAGILAKGMWNGYLYFFEQGGAVGGFAVSPLRNVSVGLSMGGSGILGESVPSWQSYPGVDVRWRFLDETLGTPAFVLGYASQGRGVYSRGRFARRQPDVFVAASKSYRFWGTGALHGTVHYTLGSDRNDGGVSFAVGAEKSIGTFASVGLEYNAALADRVEGPGLLNAAVRTSLGNGFTVELALVDILGDRSAGKHVVRNISFDYVFRW